MTIRAAEPILRKTLLRAARANAKARRATLAQVSRAAYGDARSFENISRGNQTFTTAKFDELMNWFANPANWPDGKIPSGVIVDPFSTQGSH